MTDAEYRSKIVVLQQQFDANRAAYYRKLIGITLLGYSYIVFVLLLLLGFLGILVLVALTRSGMILAIKLGIPLLILTWIIGRSLIVKIPRPDGIEVSAKDCPSLFSLLEKIASLVRTKVPNTVLIDPEFNAAVIQRPVFGFFGTQNILIIGLPLLECLTVKEFCSVLAHELGHLSKSHGRLGLWFYKTRTVWVQLFAQLESKNSFGAFLFNAFAKWFYPMFNCYSYIVARHHEIEADKIAASIAGKEITADALKKVEVVSEFLDRHFWPEITLKARQLSAPVDNIYKTLSGTVFSTAFVDKSAELYKVAFLKDPNPYDPHPSLAERIGFIGANPALPGKGTAVTAAKEVLGDMYESLHRTFSAQWKENVQNYWVDMYKKGSEERKVLADIEVEIGNGEFDQDRLYTRAKILKAEHRVDEAIDALRLVIGKFPDAADAHFALGYELLEKNDVVGVSHLLYAMKKDDLLTGEVCNRLIEYYGAVGMESEKENYAKLLEGHVSAVEQASEERESFSISDIIEPHQMTKEKIESIAKQLEKYEFLKAAYLVQKKIVHFSSHPVYIMGIFFKGNTTFMSADKMIEKRQQILENLQFPGEWFCLLLDRQTRGYRNRFLNAAGAPVFQNKE
jgi:Zn-dependent protease with chaperone function